MDRPTHMNGISPQNLRVALAGLGSVGQSIAKVLAAGGVPGIELTAVSAKNHLKARAFLDQYAPQVQVVTLAELAAHADLVIECAPANLLPEIVIPVLKAGKQIMVLSVGGLLKHPELIDLARQQGPVMHIPTGALIGLDAMLAAAEGTIHSVRMVTRKPPEGLIGAPHLLEHNIQVEGLTAPLKVFEGNALAAAKGFPANLNVVVALALAGIGPQRTMLEVWADPTIKRNVHSIVVDSDSARFSMTMENVPSENPKTSKIVGQSVIALLRKMRSGFRLGT
jgi:aspartate dehydrogenase